MAMVIIRPGGPLKAEPVAEVKEEYANEIGFDLGWDLARFGRSLDKNVVDAGLVAGYTLGQEHFKVPQHVADRFIAKWLQLRLNAFKRRRILSPEVTPSYIKQIDL